MEVMDQKYCAGLLKRLLVKPELSLKEGVQKGTLFIVLEMITLGLVESPPVGTMFVNYVASKAETQSGVTI